jgi:hypothetical protein
MADNQYVTFLLVGVLLVVIDGQVLHRGGRRFLAGSEDGSESNASMARLVTVAFHLVCLGILAVLSLVDIGSSVAALVGRLGIFLLIMAVAHGVTLSVLSRQRECRAVESTFRGRGFRRTGRSDRRDVGQETTMVPVAVDDQTHDTTVTPVPGQRGAAPRVSPTLEQRARTRRDWSR